MSKYLISLFGILGKYIAVLFNSTLKAELSLLLPIATSAVIAAELTPAGTDKFVFASNKIKAELIAGQFAIATSTVNLAIELALKELQARAK